MADKVYHKNSTMGIQHLSLLKNGNYCTKISRGIYSKKYAVSKG